MAEQIERDGAYRPPVDAKATLKVTSDRLEAYITLSRPQNNGAVLTLEQLQEALAAKNIVAGINEELLQSLAARPIYDDAILVAEGRKPVDGENCKLKYAFDTDRDIRPKEREDGTVDFKDLGIIQSVSKGDLLCTRIAPTQGTPGSDIYGKVLPSKPGKDCFIAAGKNTVLSEDKSSLHAAIDGQVQLINGKICIFDTYTVNGDVSSATGNLHFSGNVVITGGVLAGFSVHAAGDVDISGIVESAQVMVGGSLIVRGGFSGGDTGALDVGGDCTCRFIQGGKVTVRGNLETTYILNSNVSSGSSINLVGKGLIVGGTVSALSTVTANTIGSASATPTVVEVGNAPGLLKRVNEIPKDIENCEEKMQSTGTLAKTLLQLKSAGRLTPEHAVKLKKALRYLNQLKSLRDDLELELQSSQMQLELSGNGRVKVRKTAYVGVKLILGNEQFLLKTQYDFTCFSRSRDGVSCLPFS